MDPNVSNVVDGSLPYSAQTPFVLGRSLKDDLNPEPCRKEVNQNTRRVGPVRQRSVPAVDATAAANNIKSRYAGEQNTFTDAEN